MTSSKAYSSKRTQMLGLLHKLSTGPPMDIEAIASFLGRGERTARRILHDLHAAGVELDEQVEDEKTGRKSYSIPAASVSTKAVELDGLDALALRYLLARAGDGEGSLHDEIERLENKLEAALQPGLSRLFGDLRRVVRPHDRGGTTGEDSEIVETLTDAARLRHVCEVVYEKANGDRRAYALEPYQLVQHDGRLYCIGRARSHGEIHIYVVARFHEVERTREHFTLPDDFDAQSYLADSFGIFRDAPMDVRVRFTAKVARLVRERRWHPSQKVTKLPNGAIEVTLHVEGRTEIMAWVLSYAEEAELLAPADLRDELHSKLTAMLRRYEA